jgi:hypothetical protein
LPVLRSSRRTSKPLSAHRSYTGASSSRLRDPSSTSQTRNRPG